MFGVKGGVSASNEHGVCQHGVSAWCVYLRSSIR